MLGKGKSIRKGGSREVAEGSVCGGMNKNNQIQWHRCVKMV